MNIKSSATTKSLRELNDFLSDSIMAGSIDDDNLLTLRYWMDSNRHLAGNYPYDKIYSIVDDILSDGVIEEEEREQLMEILKGESVTDIPSRINSLFACHVCLTGTFSFAQKKEIEALITKCNGFNDKSVDSSTDYLFVGGKGSADWAYGNYGNKVKKAKELQEKGCLIRIMGEDVLSSFFNSYTPPKTYSFPECLDLLNPLPEESLEIMLKQIGSALYGNLKKAYVSSSFLELLLEKGILFQCDDFDWTSKLYSYTYNMWDKQSELRKDLYSRIDSLNTGIALRHNMKLDVLVDWCISNIPTRIRELFPEYVSVELSEKFLSIDLLSKIQDYLSERLSAT